ncbi:hypothetical protein J7E24_16195 [Hymenobacter sp. ISL-91]|uniref:hypothetical protein n=1 Tax=Hymenobacter sp. ISL-91 TaxID=2819151 RepID=UPI001BEB49DD|nr:hypothetical protein [Hymenobacter sp. ISL-91]MBT2559331.1 hypothetical protein [Hymenobacter sp. ISL-91]
MTTLSVAAGLLVAAALLAGCCGSQNCDTCDPLGTDDVRVAFAADTLSGGGFYRNELRDAYLVRYARRDLTGTTDTIRQGKQAGGRPPLIFYGSGYGNGFGFRQLPPPPALLPTSGATSYSFTDFSYRIVVPATGQQFSFSELETASDPGRGCCACPRNTRRRFVLDGQYTVADGSAGTTTYLRR